MAELTSNPSGDEPRAGKSHYTPDGVFIPPDPSFVENDKVFAVIEKDGVKQRARMLIHNSLYLDKERQYKYALKDPEGNVYNDGTYGYTADQLQRRSS